MTYPQGDPRLLDTDLARRLLAAPLPARLGYVATDGTPRVSPVWFHWTGQALVVGTFTPSPKVAALRSNPTVAVSIDTNAFPPELLQLRGEVELTEVRGAVPEYAAAAHRYLGAAEAGPYIDDLDRRQVPMARICLRPTWVGTLDFQTRLPAALGGVAG